MDDFASASANRIRKAARSCKSLGAELSFNTIHDRSGKPFRQNIQQSKASEVHKLRRFQSLHNEQHDNDKPTGGAIHLSHEAEEEDFIYPKANDKRQTFNDFWHNVTATSRGGTRCESDFGGQDIIKGQGMILFVSSIHLPRIPHRPRIPNKNN